MQAVCLLVLVVVVAAGLLRGSGWGGALAPPLVETSKPANKGGPSRSQLLSRVERGDRAGLEGLLKPSLEGFRPGPIPAFKGGAGFDACVCSINDETNYDDSDSDMNTLRQIRKFCGCA